MNEIKKIARELVENYFRKNKQKMGKEHYYMFSISKFILLKEKILKKDSSNNILYFDNESNAKYIPAILAFADEIKKNGEYSFNQQVIRLKRIDNDSRTLIEALWIYNKVRDSLAHGQYEIDKTNAKVLVNNDHSNERNGYKLICPIPIELLNSISFFIEEIENDDDNTITLEEYKRYVESDTADYNIDFNNVFDNSYIKKINKYFNNYKISNITNNNSKINNITNNNSKINNIINNNFKINNIINKDYIEKDYGLKKIKKIKESKEFDKLYLLLTNYEPTDTEEEIKKQDLLKRIALLLNRKEKNEEDFSNEELISIMDEMSKIIGIVPGINNKKGIIALYNYMVLTFSQTKEIDYKHICVRDLQINFDPQANGEGTGVVYKENIDSINKACDNFIDVMSKKLEDYYNNPNKKFRHSLLDHYTKFYLSIMNSIGNKNELIIRSIRNSVEHGNYYPVKNGDLFLYDQTDHNDINSIKFICKAKPQQLFEITKNIELDSDKEEYKIDDFFKELGCIIDQSKLTKIMIIMNELSKIIFGKEIDTNNSMEHMYQEALARIILQVEQKKQK